MLGKTMNRAAWALLVSAIWSTSAHAQSDPDALPFSGVYAGSEIGAFEHHYYINEFVSGSDAADGRYYRDWDVGGGAFVGYDLPIARRVRLGFEAGVNIGGGSPVARFSDGTNFAKNPEFGLRGTGRLGYLVTDRVLAYGTFGYGGQKYRIESSAGVLDATEWASSFTIGGGVEYRLARRVNLRLDFEHLDNSSNSILLGLPIRF